MIYKTILRAYPISDIVTVLTSDNMKNSISKLISSLNEDDPKIQDLLAKKYTIEYLRDHYYREVSGNKPLSLMASKHKDLIMAYLEQILHIHPNATYNRFVGFQAFLKDLTDHLEEMQELKENSTGAVASTN